MNKYQKYCFFGNEEPRSGSFVFYSCVPTVWGNPEYKGQKNANFVYGNFDEKKDVYTVFQDEDITVVEYSASLTKNDAEKKCIESIFVYKNRKWIPLDITAFPNNREGYHLVFDFNDRITKVKLVFKNNIADDYIFSIKYVEADKEKYYAKKEQERKDGLLKAASVTHSTGADLVNIYFQPCCNEYCKTEITLYKDSMMLAKYKVNEEMFFHSISGLAYGKYEFVLKQFDNKGNIILETDKIGFSLSRPNYSGRHTVVI